MGGQRQSKYPEVSGLAKSLAINFAMSLQITRLGRTGNKYYGCNVWLDDQPIEHFRNDYQDKISVVIANFTRDDVQTLKHKLTSPKLLRITQRYLLS